MGAEVKIEAEDIFDELPDMIRHEVADKAVRAAGHIVARAARRNLRRRKGATGTLAKSITVVLRKYELGSLAVVGPKAGDGWYGRLVEFGHAVKRDGRLVGHVPPHPFLRPAADDTEQRQRAKMVEIARKAKIKEVK